MAITRRWTKNELRIQNDPSLNTKSKLQTAYKSLKQNQRSSEISIYRVWRGIETNYCSYITRFDENNHAWEDTCDDLGLVQEARIIETLQEKLDQQTQEISASSLSLEQQKTIVKDLNKNLKNIIKNLEDAKLKIEEYEKPILIVEDKYDQIYKISYLKINDINFDNDNLEQVFSDYSPFVIRRAEGASSVAGTLRMHNTDGYEEKSIIGLFDYDREGSENFYHLKKGKDWDDNILGDKKSGFFKKRRNHDCFYGLLISVPDRLSNLVSNITGGQFESFVEIENLLPEKFLTDNALVEKKDILNNEYLKIKKEHKSKLKHLLVNLDKNHFTDFVPLFAKIEELLDIEEYFE